MCHIYVCVCMYVFSVSALRLSHSIYISEHAVINFPFPLWMLPVLHLSMHSIKKSTLVSQRSLLSFALILLVLVAVCAPTCLSTLLLLLPCLIHNKFGLKNSLLNHLLYSWRVFWFLYAMCVRIEVVIFILTHSILYIWLT